ncbi:MAG: PspC domain-containing protein [Solirubrobacterales bacterium]
MNETNPPKRLTRSRDDRFIGGVAAGIANYFNLDPVLIRIAFVLSIALGGIGIIAYLFLLALVPIDGDQDAPVEAPSGLKRFGVIAGTVIVGIIALASIDGGGAGGWFFGIGPGPLFGIVIWGLAIYGVYWLVRKSTRGDNAESGAFGRPTTPAASPSRETTKVVEGKTDADETPTRVIPEEPATAVTATMAASPSQNAPVAPRSDVGSTDAQRNLNDNAPSTIGRIMVWFAIGIAALIGFSVLGILSAGTTAIFGAIPMASLVILLGAGLIFAAIQNHRKTAIWLLAAAVVIAIPMAAISIADLRIEGSYGERTEEPRTASDIPEDGYKMAAGAITIDLREIAFNSTRDVNLPVRSGMGATRIIVPDKVCVTGRVEGKAGLAEIRGTEASGVGVEKTLSAPGTERGRVPGLNLDAEFKLGYFEVLDATDAKRINIRNDTRGWDEMQVDQSSSVLAASRDRAEAACLGSTQAGKKSGVNPQANG